MLFLDPYFMYFRMFVWLNVKNNRCCVRGQGYVLLLSLSHVIMVKSYIHYMKVKITIFLKIWKSTLQFVISKIVIWGDLGICFCGHVMCRLVPVKPLRFMYEFDLIQPRMVDFVCDFQDVSCFLWVLLLSSTNK